MAKKLTSPSKLKDWELIIRCTWQRGKDQVDCLAELHRRSLWLSPEQRKQAELPDAASGPLG